MCLEKKWIRNKYTGKDILVSCGHCEACLQEKADKRKQKMSAYLKRYVKDDADQLFVTLGYDNKYIPYVEKNDLDSYLDNELFNLPVYRDASFKRAFNRVREVNGKIQIKEIIHENEELFDYGFEERNFKFLRKKVNGKFSEVDGKIGVLFQKDIQDFIKRLRQHLSRKYGFTRRFYYFYCGEYGETYQRPHFHMYIIAPKGSYQMFYDSILANWWYESDDFMRKHRRIELARKPQAYISSYVNCHSFLPLFFSENSFRPCFRSATGCEFRNEDFCYDEIVRKIRRRDLRVPCKVYRDGVYTVQYVPIPSFVGGRYFPKFKGYCSLDDNEIFNAILSFGVSLQNTKFGLNYEKEDLDKFQSLFKNVFKRLNLNCFDDVVNYAYNYIDFWNIRSSNLLIDFYKEVDMNSFSSEHYDNISLFVNGRIRAPTLEGHNLHLCEMNPNNFLINRQNHLRLQERFNKFTKQKKINSITFEV